MHHVEQRNRAMCRAYLAWLANRGRTPLTVYQYAEKLENLCEFADDRPLAALTLADLESWIDRPRARRAHGTQGSDATKAKDTVVLRGLWGYLVQRGHLAFDVTVELSAPTIRNHNPKAIPPDVWSAFWHSEQLGPVERVVYGLGFFCGFRREEICRLSPEHFDTADGRIVNFPRKGDRNLKATGVLPYLSCARLFGEKRPDLIGMPEAFLEPLTALLGDRRGEPFLIPWGEAASLRRRPDKPGPPPGMTSPDQVNRRLQLKLRRLGMPERVFTPHALRHSFVTYLLEMGIPLHIVSRLAGHADVSITMRYLRLADDPLARFLGSTEEGPLGHSRWGQA
jgi:integrase